MKVNKKTVIATAVQMAIAAVIAVGIAVYQGLGAEWYWNFRCLSDGLFVSAVLFIGFGLLIWVAATGFFDIFSYGVKSLLMLFSPLKRAKEHPHYYEYKCEKASKRGDKPATHTTLLTGMIALVLSLILLAMYYHWMP